MQTIVGLIMFHGKYSSLYPSFLLGRVISFHWLEDLLIVRQWKAVRSQPDLVSHLQQAN